MKKLLLAIMTLGVLFSAPMALAPTTVYAQPKASTIDCNSRNGNLNAKNCKIIDYIHKIIQALSALVGIVILIMVVFGGIQYASSKDNPQQTSTAKQHIRDAIIALILYIFAIAFLNYIVPGGVIG